MLPFVVGFWSIQPTTFVAASPRAWSYLPMTQLKSWGRGSHSLSSFCALGRSERSRRWRDSLQLGRATGQRQLDQQWHLICSPSVNLSFSLHPLVNWLLDLCEFSLEPLLWCFFTVIKSNECKDIQRRWHSRVVWGLQPPLYRNLLKHLRSHAD